jgi:hypothetical protein
VYILLVDVFFELKDFVIPKKDTDRINQLYQFDVEEEEAHTALYNTLLFFE